MYKKLLILAFAFVMVSGIVNCVDATTKTDGLSVTNVFTYAIGKHSATGSSGKCTSNGVTHTYNYPGVTYQYYDVYHNGKYAYAHLRAKTSSDTKYYTDSSTITF